jgi:general secretion pathway protein D
MTLNQGQEIPVISTVFGAPAAGGFATIPQSSYNYRKVGVNLDITPRVTYEGEIVLELSVENSALGASVDVGGQLAPSFTSRQVSTHLRLREGEANLLAGLVRSDSSNNRQGLPGIMHIPGIKQLFARNEISDQDTDIVMLITPHVVRGHELTSEDVGSIYIGTQSNVGLTGPPPLIAPVPEAAPGGAPAGAPGTAPAAGAQPSSATAAMPNAPQAGVPGPPVAGPPGSQTGVGAATPPPGTSAVPGFIPPPGATGTTPPLTQPLPGATAPQVTPVNPPAGTTPATPPARDVAAPPTTPPAANPPPSTSAQVIVTAPNEVRVANGPYTIPVSINNASRVSSMTLTLTFNPALLRVRSVQDGTFMRQGGVQSSFTPRIDAANGRVDIAIARTADQTGASGVGLLAALVFDALSPGATAISVTGMALSPEGNPISLTFAPVTITVR